MRWHEFHEITKHSVVSLKQASHDLDWSNMPDPFRHYEGVPVLDLPVDPPAPETPALEILRSSYGTTPAVDGSTFLSQLLFYSAANSASRRVSSTGYRYALRVNPSSGNLHPTEFHFITQGLKDWPDGLYHYRPSSHMAEQRALGHLASKWTQTGSPVVFVLTSIALREAWKYGDRAYRYCLLDIGHAWQALALAARAIGFDSVTTGHFPDDEIEQLCRFHEDEWPMLIVTLSGRCAPEREPQAGEPVWYGGQVNQLSPKDVAYPRIDEFHRATKVSAIRPEGIAVGEPASTGSGEIKLPPPAFTRRSFGEVARMRRSALDFTGGPRSMSMEQLSALLASAAEPFSADFATTRFIQLYLYCHRIHGLRPGVYRFWERHMELELVRSGDQRIQAAGLSLGQDLAGNACVAFSMTADIERAVRAHGDRGYRYVHFEAGAVGHRLYLGAEALGLRATGIGAFYDDTVHDYLNLAPEEGQVVYHFAVGYPVHDARHEG
jgi:SagB-type dehydrogenase family enzyme